MKHLIPALILLVALPASAADDAPKHFATSSGLHFYAGGTVDVTEPAETVFAAGGNVNVASRDIGEVIAAGGDVNILDIVTNRVIAAGGDIDISGNITRSVIAAGGEVTVRAANIGGDAVLAGGDVSFDGNVAGDLIATGGDITISGNIAHNVQLRGGTIKLQPGTTIQGDLTYVSKNALDIPAGVRIAGTVTREEGRESRRGSFDFGVGSLIAGLVVASIFGLMFLATFAAIVLALFTRQIDRAAHVLGDEPLQSLGVGILLTLVFPVTIVILLITIIGIPFSLFMMFAGGLLAGFGAVVAAYWIGSQVREVLADNKSVPRYFPALGWTLLGLVVFCGVGLLPVVGTLAQFFALVTGCGAFVLSMMRGTTPPRGETGGAYPS